MKKKFRSIKYRIIITFITVTIFQIGAAAFFSLFQLRPQITGIYKEHQEKISDALLFEVNGTKQNIESYAINMIGDPMIQDFLEMKRTEEGDPGIYGFPVELRNKILSYINYDNRIKGIYLVDLKGRIYSNTVNYAAAEYLHEKEEKLLHNISGPLWCSDFNEEDVVLCRIVNNTTVDLNRKIGSLFIIVDRAIFQDTIRQFMTPEEKYTLKSADGYMQLGDLEEEQLAWEHSDQVLVREQVSEMFRITIWIDKKVVYRPVYDILRLLFTEMFLLLICSVGLIVFLSGRLTKPLSDIMAVMGELGSGNIEARVLVARKDEIGEVALTMNWMSSRIEELVNKIKEDQMKQRMLELKAMQYQINPHFLYNTLDSVCMYARKNKDSEITGMVTALSSYFRMSLSQGQEVITLGDEFQYALYYLEIQNFRFPGQIKWKFQIGEELKGLYILKFVLQPLIENSINHGIRNTQTNGVIQVQAFTLHGNVVIEVKDNGIGMLPEELDRIREQLEQDENLNKDPFAGGFGMRNVHQRLKLYYGEDSGLKVESIWEEGTRITIKIPKADMEQLRKVNSNELP